MTHVPGADKVTAAEAVEVLRELGANVQHTRTPVRCDSVAVTTRASCLQCGWTDHEAPDFHAQKHVRAFRHRVIVTQISQQVHSIAETEDVPL